MQTGRLQAREDEASNLLMQTGRESDSAQDERAQVVVVGAGLAGLAAAQRLYESGVRDVVVLDAQDRVGGRVHTIGHSDYLLELGAQWLHGADDNPLHQWLTKLGMLDDFQDASLGFQGIFCTSSSAAEISPRLVGRVLDVVRESKLALSKDENYLTSLNRSRLAPAAGTGQQLDNAGQVFRRHLELQMEQDEELAGNRKLVLAIFEWFLRYETIENCCDSMEEVSVQSYTDWTDFGDGTLLNFKEGYQSLLAWFCDHFPCAQWLHLGREVLNVELMRLSRSGSPRLVDSNGHARDSPILVTHKASNGASSKTKSIACDHVIVTASLGFLKGNHKTFFTPELPTAKQDLIKAVGFGTVNKIVLQFERAFWRESGGIKLVWQDADFAGSSAFPVWCRDILAFDTVRRQPELLVGWIGGRGAKLVEGESDEAVGRWCLRILERFLPEEHARPSRLAGCICSRWHSNRFTRGSYSFQSVDSLGLNVDKLHEPLFGQRADQNNDSQADQLAPTLRCGNHQSSAFARRTPRILFAGEATAGKLYSTTHGAVISGWREADRLVDHLLASKQTRNGAPNQERQTDAET